MSALYPTALPTHHPPHHAESINTHLSPLSSLTHFSTVTPSTSPLPPTSSYSNTPPNIHGFRSTRALTAMKLVDRRCIIISNTGAWPTPLSRFDALGTFGHLGEIRCSRLLATAKNATSAEPHSLLVRFASEDSGRMARLWCNGQLGLCADFGYTRYCVKFINKRQCKRKQCTLRHSFIESLDDIVADPKGDSAMRRQMRTKVTTLQRDIEALLKLRNEQTSQAQSLMNAIAHIRRENEEMRQSIETKSRLSEEQISVLGLDGGSGQGFDLEDIVDEMDAELSQTMGSVASNDEAVFAMTSALMGVQ